LLLYGTGTTRIHHIYDAVGTFFEGLAAIRLGTSWGYIDTQGVLVIPPIYASASSFSDGLAVVTRDNRSHIINRTGEVILSDMNSIFMHTEGMMGATNTNNQIGFIRPLASLAWATQSNFADVRSFREGMAAVRIGNHWGFVGLAYQPVDRAGIMGEWFNPHLSLEFLPDGTFFVEGVRGIYRWQDLGGGHFRYTDPNGGSGVAVVFIQNGKFVIDLHGEIFIMSAERPANVPVVPVQVDDEEDEDEEDDDE
jgi:hypothetical protein